MTITLTTATRIGGAVVASGTTDTYDPAIEADLVSRGMATYVSRQGVMDTGLGATTGRGGHAHGNPDYEQKSATAFTVIATDAAGNASEQAVTLAINNVDEGNPDGLALQTAAVNGATLVLTCVRQRRSADPGLHPCSPTASGASPTAQTWRPQ